MSIRENYIRQIAALCAELQAERNNVALTAAGRAGAEVKLSPLPDFSARAEELLDAEIARMAGDTLVSKLRAQLVAMALEVNG